jgi:chromosomal replication initiation ATPase DnaA
MPVQLSLPLKPRQHFTRADFLVGPGNAQGVAFVDSWPRWPAPGAVLYGPPGAGKTHLAQVWAERAGAVVIEADAVARDTEIPQGATVVENVGSVSSDDFERTLFALIERGTPLLMTAPEPPYRWQVRLPDLVSRCRALLAFGLWAPDEALLEALAEKLFAIRQLSVPKAVIAEMIRSLERSPEAVRDFVARADAEALARHRPVSVGLVRALLARSDGCEP